jgi:hypothetical protein
MSQENPVAPGGVHRRRLLRGVTAIGALGAGGLALPRTAFACHTYVSANGSKGCGAYAADLAKGSLNSGGSSSGSSPLPAKPSCSPGSSSGSSSGSTGTTTPPPAPPSTGLNTALPFGGQYLGCPIYAASKAPNGYWDKHSYRFVAQHSGAVKTVRWENRTGSGYSIGNGGSIQLSIQTDSGGRPSGQKLGSTAVYPNAAKLGKFPELPFTSQPTLNYGVTYHLVFEQLAREQGKVSVNDLHDWAAPADGPTIFPLEKGKLASIRFESNAWRVMPGYIPIYEIVYTDGVAKGQPWMDGGRGCQRNIGGGSAARQSFTMYDMAATVRGVYFAFFRDGSVGPITIRLTDSANRTLSQTSIDGNQASVAKAGDDAPVRWLYAAIGPTTFARGGTYYATFQAAAGARLWVMPATDGYFYGFRNKCGKYVSRGAQYSTSGGASWGSWPMLKGRVSNWVSLPIFLKTS